MEEELEVERSVNEREAEFTIPRLSAEAERDLTAGVKISADESDADNAVLDRLGAKLEGTREDFERREAWIRTVVPGFLPKERKKDEVPYPHHLARRLGEDDIAVEYLLPSGETFWETYDGPKNKWDEGNDVVRLLDTTGVSPGDLEQLIGSRVDLDLDGEDWSVILDSDAKTTGDVSAGEEVVGRLYQGTSLYALTNLVLGILLAISVGTTGIDPVTGLTIAVLGWSLFGMLFAAWVESAASEVISPKDYL